MNSKSYWNSKLQKYADADWSNKPSLFAEDVAKYFPDNSKILELAGGVGQDGRFFVSKGFGVVQTDLSEEGVNLMSSKVEELVKDRVEITQLDMDNPLPFENESFDVVYCHLGIHYFTELKTQEIFAEIYRILKPNGVIALLTNSTDDPEFKNPENSEKIEEDYYLFDGIKKRYFSVESMKKFAKDFEIVLLDNQGTTYKDRAIGVNNLIRFVGRKPLA
jgi:ubiquinone/menaquinone biosynthesis C-methylase UbiE